MKICASTWRPKLVGCVQLIAVKYFTTNFRMTLIWLILFLFVSNWAREWKALLIFFFLFLLNIHSRSYNHFRDVTFYELLIKGNIWLYSHAITHAPLSTLCQLCHPHNIHHHTQHYERHNTTVLTMWRNKRLYQNTFVYSVFFSATYEKKNNMPNTSYLHNTSTSSFKIPYPFQNYLRKNH